MLRVLVDGDLVVFEPTLSICTNCILTLAGVIESFQLENICVTRICFTDVSAVNFQVSWQCVIETYEQSAKMNSLSVSVLYLY